MSFDQTLTVDAFDDFIASRIRQERSVLAGTWLGRLRELLQSDPSEVFPGHDLLDHIPALLDEIAEYVRTPADEEIAANSAVVSKARELGILRHQQQASLHQVLREYEILAEVLEAFVVQEADRFTYALDALSGLRVSSRIARSVRALMHTTVETFIEQYTGTIGEQRKRLESYARMVTHEMRTLVGTIVVATGLLDREEVGQDEAHRARVVTTIKRNAERQANLIQQLQRIGLEHAPVDLPNEQRVEISVIARDS